MKDRTPAVIIALLLLGLVTTTLAMAQLAPEAPAPAPPAAPTSPGGGAGGQQAERETIQPLPPAPQQAPATTIPYTTANCLAATARPNIKVVPQQGVTLPTMTYTDSDGSKVIKQAHYAFPEPSRDARPNGWTARIGFQLENGACTQPGGQFYMRPQDPTAPPHAVNFQDYQFRDLQHQPGFIGNGYYAEMKLVILENNDDDQHRYASHTLPSLRRNRTHLAGTQPECVEFIEFVPVLKSALTGSRLEQQNRWGTIEPVIVAITGNMPHCPDRN